MDLFDVDRLLHAPPDHLAECSADYASDVAFSPLEAARAQPKRLWFGRHFGNQFACLNRCSTWIRIFYTGFSTLSSEIRTFSDTFRHCGRPSFTLVAHPDTLGITKKRNSLGF